MTLYDAKDQEEYLLASNMVGASSMDELERAEKAASSARIVAIQYDSGFGHFDTEHLKAIHRYILGDVYSFAGQFRNVEIGKGDAQFCRSDYIESEAGRIFRELSSEGLFSGLGRDAFLDRLTYYAGELNALHPFREGNGRAARVLLNQLSVRNGYLGGFRWGEVSEQENLDASIASYRGDDGPMLAMLGHILD